MIDTCSLVNIRDIHNDSEKIWGAVIIEIEAGRLKTVRHVADELSRRFPEIYRRFKACKREFLVPDSALYSTEAILEIREIQKHHPGLINPLGGGNPADPFLIATAKLSSAIVVTDERSTGPRHKSKIPFVCMNRNVGWLPGLDYLKGLGYAKSCKGP
jgi:Domain of unknown function (DUF4411)